MLGTFNPQGQALVGDPIGSPFSSVSRVLELKPRPRCSDSGSGGDSMRPGVAPRGGPLRGCCARFPCL